MLTRCKNAGLLKTGRQPGYIGVIHTCTVYIPCTASIFHPRNLLIHRPIPILHCLRLSFNHPFSAFSLICFFCISILDANVLFLFFFVSFALHAHPFDRASYPVRCKPRVVKTPNNLVRGQSFTVRIHCLFCRTTTAE